MAVDPFDLIPFVTLSIRICFYHFQDEIHWSMVLNCGMERQHPVSASDAKKVLQLLSSLRPFWSTQTFTIESKK
jgi:hypothetical protein